MLHEIGHFKVPVEQRFLLDHDGLDGWARGTLYRAGLGGMGCTDTKTFFFWNAFPSCNLSDAFDHPDLTDRQLRSP